MIYLSGNVVLFLGMFAPIIFLAPYAKDKGVDDYNSAFLLSVMAFTDMFARPSIGLIANTSLIRPRIQYLFSVAIMFTGICHLLCPLAHSYTALVVYVIFFGIGFGSISSLLFECLMDQVGASRFSSAVGLVTIVECCPVLFGPPLAGKLLDITGQYKYLYIASGIVVLSSGIYLLICNAINYRLLEKERKREKARRKKSASQASKEMEALSRSKQDDVTVKVAHTHNPPSDRDKESSI